MAGYGDPPKENQFSKDKQPEHPGRPKGSLSIKTILSKLLDEELDIVNPLTQQKEKMTVAKIIQMQKISKAMKGDMKAIEMIEDRMEGKPVSKNEHTGKDGEPLVPPSINFIPIALKEEPKQETHE
jgi:hypothetical protein